MQNLDLLEEFLFLVFILFILIDIKIMKWFSRQINFG